MYVYYFTLKSNCCIIVIVRDVMERGLTMAQISFRVDDEVKDNAERTLDDIGLNMSTAINIFLKAVVRENCIPFALSADPFIPKKIYLN